MGTILIILLSTVTIIVCTLVVVRRGREEDNSAAYLESPTWGGLMADGTPPRTDLTAPAVPAPSAPPPPEGARLRGATPHTGSPGDERLVDEVLHGLRRIPPLPHVLFQVLGEINDAGSSAKSLASIVATEPVLTASMLRVANSASAGLERRIISVDEAVAYLGYSAVRSLVLRMKLADLMPQRHHKGYDSEHLWLHSLVVGHVAAHLAQRAGGADVWLVSTIGLLHDIGKLAINSQFPDAVAQLWDRSPGPADESFLARERRLFGADHAFIGGFLAAQWKLPPELVEAIRLHHLPDESALAALSPDVRRATQLVHVANQLAKYAHVYCADMEIDIVHEHLLRELNLPQNLEDLLTDELRQLIARAANLSGNSRSSPFGDDDALRALQTK